MVRTYSNQFVLLWDDLFAKYLSPQTWGSFVTLICDFVEFSVVSMNGISTDPIWDIHWYIHPMEWRKLRKSRGNFCQVGEAAELAVPHLTGVFQWLTCLKALEIIHTRLRAVGNCCFDLWCTGRLKNWHTHAFKSGGMYFRMGIGVRSGRGSRHQKKIRNWFHVATLQLTYVDRLKIQ